MVRSVDVGADVVFGAGVDADLPVATIGADVHLVVAVEGPDALGVPVRGAEADSGRAEETLHGGAVGLVLDEAGAVEVMFDAGAGVEVGVGNRRSPVMTCNLGLPSGKVASVAIRSSSLTGSPATGNAHR